MGVDVMAMRSCADLPPNLRHLRLSRPSWIPPTVSYTRSTPLAGVLGIIHQLSPDPPLQISDEINPLLGHSLDSLGEAGPAVVVVHGHHPGVGHGHQQPPTNRQAATL